MRTLKDHSDAELAGLLRSDDRAAFAEIYERYWRKMLLVAWNHCPDKAQAEDVVHEVFISFWDKRDTTFVQNIPAFLTTCVKFAIFKNYQRTRRRQELAQLHYAFEDLTLEEERWDALFLKEYLDGLIEELPEKCRLAFRYSRVEQLSNAEIAERMGISEKGVEAHITRGLKVLRSNLEGSGLLVLISAEILKQFPL